MPFLSTCSQAFKDGDVRFLICTDVAARGLDIQVGLEGCLEALRGWGLGAGGWGGRRLLQLSLDCAATTPRTERVLAYYKIIRGFRVLSVVRVVR